MILFSIIPNPFPFKNRIGNIGLCANKSTYTLVSIKLRDVNGD